MKINQFKSYAELISTPVNESEYNQILQIIEEIHKMSLENQTWIGVILDFLNDNDTGKYYSEHYLTPDFSYGTRRNTYRFISTQEDIPSSITDSDVEVLNRLKAQTQFILYDYEEEPSADVFAYWNKQRTLKDVLKSIGMTEELKQHLCEFCFYQLKQSKKDLKKEKVWNPSLWHPLDIKPVKMDDMIDSSKSTGGFVPYQAPNDRYEVRGIMPPSKPTQLTREDETGLRLVKKKNNSQKSK